MTRSLIALVLAICLSTSVMGDVVTIPLSFTPASSSYNRITVNIDSSIGDDTQTADVLTGSYVQLELDYTIDPTTRKVTSLNSIEFVGGSYDLEDTHFELSILADIYGKNIGGTFYTPSPPGSITSSTTTTSEPYVNTSVFPTEEHMIRVDRGYLKIDPLIGDTTYYYLDDNPLWGTTESDGSLVTTLTSVVGGVANYDVEFTFPAYFQETVEDVISATITGSGTFKATGSFSIQPSNYAPVAVDDSFETDEDVRCIKYNNEGILPNDTDADSDPLTAYKITDPEHGTVAVWSTGGFTYTPEPNYFGTDSFTYKAFDGTDWSDEATVTFNITSVNDAPIALDDNYSCDEDDTLVIYNNEGLLVNDSDVDDAHSVLKASLQDGPSHGDITWWPTLENGSFTYRPDPGFSGMDSFTYKAYDDENAFSDLTTVWIEVIAAPLDIPGDTNDDDIVNEVDAAVVAANWEKSVTGGVEDGDFNGDGWVDATDASIMAANWGDHTGDGSGAPVPEPSAVFLLAAGLVTMGLMRRRVAV